jgi:3-phenylpropionate/trans-cinnamate dioxygenase ferredoxin reductase component
VTLRDVVVVGGSTAGTTAMRELRRRGFEGRLTLLDPCQGTHRPPLSKDVLGDAGQDATVTIDHASLDIVHVRSEAAGLDSRARVVTDGSGATHPYDALLVATGGRARRIARPDQRGELVLRTLDDARMLRERMAHARSVVVVGGGFLGLEVATAAAKAGAHVTVVDPEPPLSRILGDHLAGRLVDCAGACGITFRRTSARLYGNPVSGVQLGDGSVLTVDLVVTCAGDVPDVACLDDSGLASPGGVLIDHSARTRETGIWAAGDVASVLVDGQPVRRPFWANAVTQGRVAAASMLEQPIDDPIFDHYFWTEVGGMTLKAVGLLPAAGAPSLLEENDSGGALLAFGNEALAALGLRRSVPRLKTLLRDLQCASPTDGTAP